MALDDEMKFTPENIFNLEPNEIFVFGSNLAGIHAGGAAHFAYNEFGASWGDGVGPFGQTYALPTMDENLVRLPLNEISRYIKDFIRYTKGDPTKTFIVTKIGCGIAGFKVSEIAPLFFENEIPENVILPEEFYAFFNG